MTIPSSKKRKKWNAKWGTRASAGPDEVDTGDNLNNLPKWENVLLIGWNMQGSHDLHSMAGNKKKKSNEMIDMQNCATDQSAIAATVIFFS